MDRPTAGKLWADAYHDAEQADWKSGRTTRESELSIERRATLDVIHQLVDPSGNLSDLELIDVIRDKFQPPDI